MISAFFASVLPIVTAAHFAVGNFWVWSYYEQGDHSRFYSSEKYQVTEVAGTTVTFEIWTMYAGKTSYTPSAKFKVDLKDCHASFSSGSRVPFTIEMYAYSNGRWSNEAYQMHSTAFEEKFNCNGVEYSLTHPSFQTLRETVATQWGSFSVFQQKPKSTSQILSFYFTDHPKLAGVAYKKAFNAQSPYEFAFELTDFRM